MSFRFFRFLLALLLFISVPAQALTSFQKLDSVKAELIAQTEGAKPGTELTVGVLLKHAPSWHTYWKATGDTGLPTRISWTLPEGWKASDIAWPTPKVFKIGDFINYGYEGEVLLPVKISVPKTASAGSGAVLTAKLSWLMCQDQCVPGGATVSLTVPVIADPAPSAYETLFLKTKTEIPSPAETDFIRLDPKTKKLQVALRIPDLSGSDFYVFAEGEQSIVYGAPQSYELKDGTLCLYLQADSVSAGAPFDGIVVADGGPKAGGWARSFSASVESGAVTVPAAGAAPKTELTAWLALGFAFLGGLILNLMPCVFPVLSLKILGLVAGRRQSRASLLAHGASFAAGVLLSMCALAGILLALKSTGTAVGWGFQLQSPLFVAALALLFVAIGLNLAGAFEFNFRVSLAGGAQKSGDTVLSSFSTGILAVIAASPCTAPFMGAALGYALTAPALLSFFIFIALGLGMSLPWVVLTALPELTRWLPKPGLWMVRFKQILSVPIFLTAVWLLWVLWAQVNEKSFALLMLSAVLFAVGLVFFGRSQFGSRPAAVRAKVLAACFAAAFAAFLVMLRGAEDVRGEEAWSPQAVEASLKDGVPVFVDFTARWCVTCQANKVAVLKTKEFQSALKKYGVRFMVADWTNYDPQITKTLEALGRSGVPLYVLYLPDGKTEILPELLTTKAAVGALQKARR
jgi:thiol:disulfide interchange protein DsbD